MHLPLLVGVTGHRDPIATSRAALDTAMTAVLTALASLAGGGTLHVVSALAGGADQLVADVAERLAIPLIAIAPMPLVEYRGTLQAPDTRDRMQHHWERAVLRLELPWVDASHDHALQYEQLGVLLSRQSHVLLALWNGLDDKKVARRNGRPDADRGGSAHVVDMRIIGERAAALPALFRTQHLFSGPPPLLELSHSGPIIHIVTPRTAGAHTVSSDEDRAPYAAGTVRWWSDAPPAVTRRSRESAPVGTTVTPADASGWELLSTSDAVGLRDQIGSRLPQEITAIVEFNGRLAGFSDQDARLMAQQESLCPGLDLAELAGPEACLTSIEWLRRLQAAVDLTATRYQRRVVGEWSPGLPLGPAVRRLRAAGTRLPELGALFLFAGAVPAGTLAYETYAHLWHHSGALVGYLAAVGGALAFNTRLVRRERWQESFQDSRALAEALRVQFFWALAGMPVSVSDNYLGYQSNELGWIRQALRGPALWGTAAALAVEQRNDRLLLKNWIEAQRCYFQGSGDGALGAAANNRAAAERLERAAGAFLALALGLASVLILAHALHTNLQVGRVRARSSAGPAACCRSLLRHHQ